MYLSYAEYQTMGGTLSERIFNDYEFRAEMIINYRTFNRLIKETTIPKQVKNLVKQIVDLVSKKSATMNLGKGQSSDIYVTSQSNDGVSTQYSGMASSELFSICDNEIQMSISMFLAGAKTEDGRSLLFRGLYKGE